MITDKQESNLRILAAYLLSGNLKANFDMEVYSENNSSGIDKTDCGSVGCAIGHGPYAGIPKNNNETWGIYTGRAFSNHIFHLWQYCFSPSWSYIDNTPQGAGQRILNFLNDSPEYQKWLENRYYYDEDYEKPPFLSGGEQL
jgi:hypothetical protein